MQVAAAYLPLDQGRPNRTGPVVLTIAIHLLIGYGLAISVGIVPMPTFVPDINVVDVPIREKPPAPVENLAGDSATYTLTVIGPTKPAIDVEDPGPPAKDRIVTDGGGTTTIAPSIAPQTFAPRLVRSMEPMYPSVSRIKEEEGVVHVRVTITSYGTIGEVQVERSSGYARLDDAALKAVREWRFAPAMRGKEAIVGSVIVPVRFELKR